MNRCESRYRRPNGAVWFRCVLEPGHAGSHRSNPYTGNLRSWHGLHSAEAASALSDAEWLEPALRENYTRLQEAREVAVQHREQDLVLEFLSTGEGSFRREVRIGRGTADLVDRRRGIIVEAKARADAASVYSGIGQLMVRKAAAPWVQRLVLLLPEQPNPELAAGALIAGVEILTPRRTPNGR